MFFKIDSWSQVERTSRTTNWNWKLISRLSTWKTFIWCGLWQQQRIKFPGCLRLQADPLPLSVPCWRECQRAEKSWNLCEPKTREKLIKLENNKSKAKRKHEEKNGKCGGQGKNNNNAKSVQRKLPAAHKKEEVGWRGVLPVISISPWAWKGLQCWGIRQLIPMTRCGWGGLKQGMDGETGDDDCVDIDIACEDPSPAPSPSRGIICNRGLQ